MRTESASPAPLPLPGTELPAPALPDPAEDAAADPAPERPAPAPTAADRAWTALDAVMKSVLLAVMIVEIGAPVLSGLPAVRFRAPAPAEKASAEAGAPRTPPAALM